MKHTTIDTDELARVYKVIQAKISSSTDKMTAALNSENEEEFEIQLERFSKLRDMRAHLVQRIDMIAEILGEVADIADEVRKI